MFWPQPKTATTPPGPPYTGTWPDLCDLAENMSHPQAVETQEHVASIRQFIEENRGKGVGVDGSEFGQGVSENNPGHSDDEPSSEGPNKEGQSQGGGRDNQGLGQNSGRGNGSD
jgi:hypothetical protein